MKILVACEESQRVCIAFRNAGHEAWSCDIQDESGGYPQWHIKGDALKEAYSGKYDMMVGFPPCTYLSNAGARHLYPGGVLNESRYKKGLEAKKFFLALWNAPIKHIALENPTPSKIYSLPEYTQVIHPYFFGHPYSKRTLLWLKRLSPLRHTRVLSDYQPYIVTKSVNTQKEYFGVDQKQRSKTFEGIAQAMADQWSVPKYVEQLSLF
jgi:hypothetical protein